MTQQQERDEQTAAERYDAATTFAKTYEALKPDVAVADVGYDWLEEHGVEMKTDFVPAFLRDYVKEAVEDGDIPLEPVSQKSHAPDVSCELEFYRVSCVVSALNSLDGLVGSEFRYDDLDDAVRWAASYRLGRLNATSPPSLSDGSKGQYRVAMGAKKGVLRWVMEGSV